MILMSAHSALCSCQTLRRSKATICSRYVWFYCVILANSSLENILCIFRDYSSLHYLHFSLPLSIPPDKEVYIHVTFLLIWLQCKLPPFTASQQVGVPFIQILQLASRAPYISTLATALHRLYLNFTCTIIQYIVLSHVQHYILPAFSNYRLHEEGKCHSKSSRIAGLSSLETCI